MSPLFDASDHPEWDHTCDICFGCFPPDRIAEHMREAHGITEPAAIGYVKQDNGILTIEDGTGKMVVDLGQWFLWKSLGCPDWFPNGIIENTRKDGGSHDILSQI